LQNYILRRLFQGLLVLFITSIIIFVAIRILPGDPILTRQGATNVWSEEMAREQRHKFGLDKPIPAQYVDWLTNALRGDFGVSYFNQFPVTELIQRKWLATVELAAAALILALLVGIPSGALAALKSNSWIDYIVSGIVAIGISIPGFWLGIMLVILFAVELKWLPPSGYVPITENPQGNLRFLILPALTLAIIPHYAILAGQPARGSEPGLYSHGARQGHDRESHSRRACLSQRVDSYNHHSRHHRRKLDRRRRGDRVGF
jgi:peptide/nickel transport system permease protein